MNWPKVWLKYQRYGSSHSCFGARKIICWSEFSEIGGTKEKGKEKNGQIWERKKENNF